MPKTALIIIDLQNDYFYGGKCCLEGIEFAAQKAVALLNIFRDKDLPVIYVCHESETDKGPFFLPGSEGVKIHPSVKNLDDEPVLIKHQINSFRDTNLKETLDSLSVDSVLICGAMSNMCIDAATRAAHDFGYNCTVAHDACVASNLEFKGIMVPAIHVHAAFMAALDVGYANVASTDELLMAFNQSP